MMWGASLRSSGLFLWQVGRAATLRIAITDGTQKNLN
jgi:hypothetical protein